MAAKEISKEQWAAWEKIYATGWRQLHRWRSEGIENNDLCPLDDPKQMPIWWARNRTHTCPPKILQAARDAGANDSDLPSPRSGKSSTPQAPIDLSQFDMDEGEPVSNQRRLCAALYHQLDEAYKNQRPTDLLQSQYVRAAKALRELERDDRDERQRRGKFVSREIYERDAATAADMLRQMHDSMQRRALELCPGLPAKQRKLVVEALGRVFIAQRRVFERITSFSNTDDLLAELAAA